MGARKFIQTLEDLTEDNMPNGHFFILSTLILVLSSSRASCKDRAEIDISGLDSEIVQHDDHFLVKYSCSSFTIKQVVGFSLYAYDQSLSDGGEMIMFRSWDCVDDGEIWSNTNSGAHNPLQNAEKKPRNAKFVRIQLKLPPIYRFRPGHFQSAYSYKRKFRLRAWIVDSLSFIRLSKLQNQPELMYKIANYNKEFTFQIDPPYSRKSRLDELCLSFAGEILEQRDSKRIYKCPFENEVLNVVKYPLLLNGNAKGMPFRFEPYSDRRLEMERTRLIDAPRVSYVLWVYVKEYCRQLYCSVINKSDYYQQKYSPTILINYAGNIVIELVEKDGALSSIQSARVLPANDWCRVVITLEKSQWTISINCLAEFEQNIFTYYLIPKPFQYKESDVVSMLGGSDLYRSFEGYVGKLTVYRRQIVDPNQLGMVSKDDPMFKLDIKRSDDYCLQFSKNLKYYRRRISNLRERLAARNTCPAFDFLAIAERIKESQKRIKQCSIYSKKILKDEVDLYKKLRKSLLRSDGLLLLGLDQIGKFLYEKVLEDIKANGFKNMESAIKLLAQASCLKFHEASFMLSVIYAHGIGIKSDPVKSSFYLMKAASDGDRLSLLALGFKHRFGLDGFDRNLHQSFYYYRQVAMIVIHEIHNPRADERYAEYVRLTDQRQLSSVTREDGDLFQWLKDQARRNVMSAQNQLSSMLYWGSQGVKRNIKAGVELFKRGAERKDPSSLFSYGLALLNGQGTERNLEEAIKNFEEAAKLGYHKAYTSLGHIAYEYQRNPAKAVQYWMQGWNNARDADCAFNLGFIWSEGLYPNEPKNLLKAWGYWSYAASVGQVNSQLKVVDFNAFGYGIIPIDQELATSWASFVAEKTSVLGKYLQQGVLAYQDKDWELALLFYLMGASAGTEVANFNTAFICEENPENIVSDYIESECMIKYYNRSVNINLNFANSHALNKLGDYYYDESVKKSNKNGAQRARNSFESRKAYEYYARTYLRGDNQGLFNLALLIEEGYHFPAGIWTMIKLKDFSKKSKYDQLIAIYERCVSGQSGQDAFLPCSLALAKVKLQKLYHEYFLVVQIVLAICFTLLTGLSMMLIKNRLRTINNHNHID